jgi:hypothetical protein
VDSNQDSIFATLDGKVSGYFELQKLKQLAGLSVNDSSYTISGFDMTIQKEDGYNLTLRSGTGKFTKEMEQSFKNYTSENKFIAFDNITAKLSNHEEIKLKPLVFRISKLNDLSAFALVKNNVVYIGVDNPIQIVCENNFESITVTTGKIWPANNNTIGNGGYFFRTDSISMHGVKMNIYRDGVLKGSSIFKTIYVPLPTAIFAQRKDGELISKEFACVQDRLNAGLVDFLYDVHFEVASFNLKLMIDGIEVIEPSDGYRLSDKQKLLLHKKKSGEKISFTQIIVKDPSGSIRKIDDTTLTIK